MASESSDGKKPFLNEYRTPIIVAAITALLGALATIVAATISTNGGVSAGPPMPTSPSATSSHSGSTLPATSSSSPGPSVNSTNSASAEPPARTSATLSPNAAVRNYCGTSGGADYEWEESGSSVNGLPLDEGVECILNEYDAYSNKVQGDEGPFAQIDFVVPAGFNEFRATVGFSDETPDPSMRAKVSVVSAAGEQLTREQDLTAAKPVHLRAPVKDGRRVSLRVRITNPADGGIRDLNLIAGDFSLASG